MYVYDETAFLNAVKILNFRVRVLSCSLFIPRACYNVKTNYSPLMLRGKPHPSIYRLTPREMEERTEGPGSHKCTFKNITLIFVYEIDCRWSQRM